MHRGPCPAPLLSSLWKSHEIPGPRGPYPSPFPSVLTVATCHRPLWALPFSAWDTPCPGIDLASFLTSCLPGLHGPSWQDLEPMALRFNHPFPISFFLHYHHLPTDRITSSFLLCLSPPTQNHSSWKAGPCPVDPEFLDTDWHTVAPTKNFWQMNELSLACMGPSVWPVGQGQQMALAWVRMGPQPHCGRPEADLLRQRTLNKQEVRVCSMAPAAPAWGCLCVSVLSHPGTCLEESIGAAYGAPLGTGLGKNKLQASQLWCFCVMIKNYN